VFDFNKAYPENDGTQIAKLGIAIAKEERNAIAAWAVEGYMRMKRRNMITLPFSSKPRQDQMAEANNSVRLYLSSKVSEAKIRLGQDAHKKHPINYTPILPLFNDYGLFCRHASSTAVPLNSFELRLGELQSRFGFKLELEGATHVCRWLTLCERA
jgi:hypothetical protein